MGLGIAAALVSLFIVPLINGLPVAGGWAAMAFVRPFLINGCWATGLGLLLVLRSRQALRRMLWHPGELGLAQAYVTGELDVTGDLTDGLRAVWQAARDRGRGRRRLSRQYASGCRDPGRPRRPRRPGSAAGCTAGAGIRLSSRTITTCRPRSTN